MTRISIAWVTTNAHLVLAVYTLAGLSQQALLTGVLGVVLTSLPGLGVELSAPFSAAWWLCGGVAIAASVVVALLMWAAVASALRSSMFAPRALRVVLRIVTGSVAVQWFVFPAVFYVAHLRGGGLAPAAVAGAGSGPPPHPAVLQASGAGAGSWLTMEAEMVCWAFLETCTKGTLLLLCGTSEFFLHARS